MFASASAEVAVAPLALAQQTASPEGKLVKVVILSRHGVRSPTVSQEDLDTWTTSKWPVWWCDNNKVCEPGQLTPIGRKLSQQMGIYYRHALSTLLPGQGCPAASDVYFWADVTERTRETARALLTGFRPGCDISLYFNTAGTEHHDPTFRLVKHDGACRLDMERAEADMLARAGGDLAHVEKSLAPELAIVQRTLQCCRPKLCEAASASCRRQASPPNTCTLTDRLPSCLVPHPAHGHATDVRLGGALRTASTFAEILLLEYANGLPTSDVGWGRITRQQMTQVFRLHTTAFDIEERTPYIATMRGTPLLARITRALADEKSDAPGSAPPRTKFVAYVGHDTNISNVASMLDLTWQQPGYQKNQTPPAGALVFELRETATGARNVHVFYDAASLDDLRALKALHPVRTPVRVPGCGAEGSACSLADFAKLAGSKLERSCMH